MVYERRIGASLNVGSYFSSYLAPMRQRTFGDAPVSSRASNHTLDKYRPLAMRL